MKLKRIWQGIAWIYTVEMLLRIQFFASDGIVGMRWHPQGELLWAWPLTLPGVVLIVLGLIHLWQRDSD